MANPAVAISQRAAPSRYNGLDKMLVNGVWRSGRSGQTAEDRDPHTNEILLRVPLADERDRSRRGFSGGRGGIGLASGAIIGSSVGHAAAGALIGGPIGLLAGAMIGDQLMAQDQQQDRQERNRRHPSRDRTVTSTIRALGA